MAARGALAVGHGVHHFAAAVDAIAAGEVVRIAGLAGGADRPRCGRRAVRCRELAAAAAQAATARCAGITMSQAISNSMPGIGFGQRRPSHRLRRAACAANSTAAARPSGPTIATGCASQWKLHAFLLGVLVLEVEGGHLAFRRGGRRGGRSPRPAAAAALAASIAVLPPPITIDGAAELAKSRPVL